MKIYISDDASKWYKSEMFLEEGDYVRFFARYGGCSNIQQGFSLGISNEEPIDAGIKEVKDGVIYFIEEKDLWYFDNHDLHVTFDSKLNEPVYQYEN
ncbi:HesB/YadR/YfhF family protein [Bacillaceae bacterium Marseille-Q3522]|nr:HesB/YadR/YfhF family protein [Bacillaceae bacterium Marseille-Q3522]